MEILYQLLFRGHSVLWVGAMRLLFHLSGNLSPIFFGMSMCVLSEGWDP